MAKPLHRINWTRARMRFCRSGSIKTFTAANRRSYSSADKGNVGSSSTWTLGNGGMRSNHFAS